MSIRLLAILASLLVIMANVAIAICPSQMSTAGLCGVNTTLWLQDSLYFEDGLRPTASGWSLYGDDPGTIVDLGSGNSGITQSSDITGDWDEWLKTYQSNRMAISTRFRIEAEDSASNIVQLAAKGVTPEIGIGIRNHRLAVVNYKNNTVITDLGAVVLGQFYEGGLYVDAPSGTAGWWLDGANGNQAVTVTGNCATAFAEFGASLYDAPNGSSTITYDWVGVYVPEPSSVVALLAGGLCWALASRRRA